jgi:site-specific recombinase XerD
MDLSRIDDYLRTLGRSERTVDNYEWALRKKFVDVVGEAASLDHETYTTFLASLSPYSPSTKSVLVAAVDGFYAFCEAGDPARMRAARRHYIKKQKTKPVNFDIDAVTGLIETLSNPRYIENRVKQAEPAWKEITYLSILRDAAFVKMCAFGGFRISEALSLTRGDIDYKNMRSMIVGKGEKHAMVYFSKASIDALRTYLNARAKLDGDSGKPLSSLPVFASHDRRGKYQFRTITVAGMRKSFHTHGFPIRVHDLRHYFVTMILLGTEGNLKLAQELARHSSINTTGRYAHLTNSQLEKGYHEVFG